MLKLTLGQIVNAEQAIGKLNKLSTEEQLEFKLTYKLTKLIKKLQPELQDFYEQRNKILQKYGVEVMTSKKDETTGEETQVSSGQWEIKDSEKFKKYIDQLINIDIEFDNVFPFKEDELAEVKGLSTEDVVVLEPFIEVSADKVSTRKKIEINFDEDVEVVE